MSQTDTNRSYREDSWWEKHSQLDVWPNPHLKWVSRWWFFTNPAEKYADVKLDHFPKDRGEHIKNHLKPPPPRCLNHSIWELLELLLKSPYDFTSPYWLVFWGSLVIPIYLVCISYYITQLGWTDAHVARPLIDTFSSNSSFLHDWRPTTIIFLAGAGAKTPKLTVFPLKMGRNPKHKLQLHQPSICSGKFAVRSGRGVKITH